MYFHDTRFLKRDTLRIAGRRPLILLSQADRAESISELSNPDLHVDDNGTVLSKDTLSIRRHRQLDGCVKETIKILNFGSDPIDVPLQMEFDADFENMFTIRGTEPGERGQLHAPCWNDSRLIFRYDGADKHTRTTTVTFEPAPTEREDGKVLYRLQMKAGEEQSIALSFGFEDHGRNAGTLEKSPPRLQPNDIPSWTRVESDNPMFDRTIQHSLADLEMLTMRERGDVFFAAGVPWYVALFGRDSLITALETLAFQPAIAASTLELLAQYQGTKVDKRREEQPGKILHEFRVGERANLHEIPQTPYYGTVDATPLFVIVLAEYIRWTGDIGLWRRLRSNVEAALRWIDDYGDSDGDGFVDYQASSHQGMDNQGWKDSWNGVRNRDGSLAEPPIALVEVQGYVYRAQLAAAELYRRDGDEGRATKLELAAGDLRRRFRRAYWMEERACLAQALQKDGRQVGAITSNPGQALWGGIVDHDQAQAVARSLSDPSMSSGWGIRTLAEGEAAYNPIDYQVGSVWPHDNALIAAGLKRYGFHEQALRIFSDIFKAATLFPLYRLPEVFAGFSSDRAPRPIRYPVACSPQAWSAGALPYMLQTVLGLEPRALEGELHIVSPSLPDGLQQVTVRGLRVGSGSIDLRYQRSEDGTLVAVLGRRGEIEVTIQS